MRPVTQGCITHCPTENRVLQKKTTCRGGKGGKKEKMRRKNKINHEKTTITDTEMLFSFSHLSMYYRSLHIVKTRCCHKL